MRRLFYSKTDGEAQAEAERGLCAVARPTLSDTLSVYRNYLSLVLSCGGLQYFLRTGEVPGGN